VASTRTRIQSFAHTVPEAENDTYDRAWWSLVNLYGAGDNEDVVARCRVCALDGVATVIFLKDGVSSNGTKHYEATAIGRASESRRGDHLRSALYLEKNIKGGARTRHTAPDGSITKFLRPADRREHHLRFVVMQVMTSSSHAFASSDFVRAFLAGFRVSNAPPANNILIHHLTEIAAYVATDLQRSLADIAKAYGCIPWAHVSTDMWTARHSRESYGAVIVRYVDLDTLLQTEKSLGVWRFPGKHDHQSIQTWLIAQRASFNLAVSDVASSTTDAGANVKKALDELGPALIACVVHGLHNAVRHALGASGETPNRRAARVMVGGRRTQRARVACRNAPANELLGQLRATVRFFQHSDAAAQQMSGLPIAEDPAIRHLQSEMATRWGSTYLSLSRLYTMWPRVTAFFRSPALTADQRERRVLHRDWDQLHYMIAVLAPVYEVTNSVQSATATLAEVFPLLVPLRHTLQQDVIQAPKYPELPLSVGAAAIEAYLVSNADVAVMKIDNRLYLIEWTHVDVVAGRECLCEAAPQTVYVLLQELDRIFFNPQDKSKNWLENLAVLKAVVLCPGGLKLLGEVAEWIGCDNPAAGALEAVKWAAKGSYAAEEVSNLSQTAASATADGHGAPVSDERAAARSSLLTWKGRAGAEPSPAVAAPGAQRVVQDEVDNVLRLCQTTAETSALSFWGLNRQQFPALFPLAASALGAAASSASCEREFSIAGRLVRPERSSLSVTSVEMHSLVGANADVLPTDAPQCILSLTHGAAAAFRSGMNTYVPAAGDGEEEEHWTSGTDEEELED